MQLCCRVHYFRMSEADFELVPPVPFRRHLHPRGSQSVGGASDWSRLTQLKGAQVVAVVVAVVVVGGGRWFATYRLQRIEVSTRE